jgi:hypothetical protein
MTYSGISILASKLSGYKGPTNRESVKLSDSIAQSPSPVVTPVILDDASVFKEELELLIAQTEQQERTLLHFHTELARSRQQSEYLKSSILESRLDAVRKRQLSHALYMLKYFSKSGRQFINPTLMVESLNLNETLKNLARQLDSPTGDDVEVSQVLSTSIPFNITRNHFRK